MSTTIDEYTLEMLLLLKEAGDKGMALTEVSPKLATAMGELLFTNAARAEGSTFFISPEGERLLEHHG